MTIQIVDISSWEDSVKDPRRIDFAQMAKNAQAVIYRAANGSLPDATFEQFVADNKSLPWAAYGILYPGDADFIDSQAAQYIHIVETHPGWNVLIVDWEIEGVTWQMVAQYITLLQRAFPAKPIWIYSRTEYLLRMLPSLITKPASRKWFQQFRLWLAQYNLLQVIGILGFGVVAKQYTDRADASKYGISEAKGVDLSVWTGTDAEFAAAFPPLGDVAIPSPDPVTPSEPYIPFFPGSNDHTPPPVGSPLPKPNGTLYRVAAENWSALHDGQKRPAGQGPLTQYLSSATKKGDNQVKLTLDWQNYIHRWNPYPAAWNAFVSGNVGPTFGINAKGLMVYLGLVYPCLKTAPRVNYVKITKQVTGKDGQQWGVVDAIDIGKPVPSDKDINPTLTPWLFHVMYAGDGSSLPYTCVVPLLKPAGMNWYVPMKALERI